MYNPFESEPQEPRPNRLLQPVSIPLGRAFFCLSCEHIHNSIRCPHCDRGPSIPIEKWLGREEA